MKFIIKSSNIFSRIFYLRFININLIFSIFKFLKSFL
nr:MAG TPA: hypothetical protein [Caudoviricetes sp.]